MRYLVTIFVMIAALTGSIFAMTPEETTVRNAYAKLAYAVDIHTVYQGALTNPQLTSGELAKLIALHGMRFTLSDFTVGDLKDIANVPYTTAFPGYPNGQDVIDVTLAQVQSDEDGKAVSTDMAKAAWGPGPKGNPLAWSVREMMPIMERESGVDNLSRYATYTVTVTFAGKTLTYKAAFLFSESGQAAPADTVVGLGGGVFVHFLTHPLYPDVLLRTHLRKQIAVDDYLNKTQRDDATCNSGDACCDPATLQCRVSAADLRRLP